MFVLHLTVSIFISRLSSFMDSVTLGVVQTVHMCLLLCLHFQLSKIYISICTGKTPTGQIFDFDRTLPVYVEKLSRALKLVHMQMECIFALHNSHRMDPPPPPPPPFVPNQRAGDLPNIVYCVCVSSPSIRIRRASLRMFVVEKSTSMEKRKVHIGSATFQVG